MSDPLLIPCPHCNGLNRIPAERLTATLTPAERAAIFGDNAARIYLTKRGRRPSC